MSVMKAFFSEKMITFLGWMFALTVTILIWYGIYLWLINFCLVI